MKCSEVKNFFQSLLDDEIAPANKHKIKMHLDACDLCRVDFEDLQATRKMLKKQPPILPAMSFDNRVLQAFENHRSAKQGAAKSWFTALFAIPKPALAFAFGVFVLALGLTFLLGRMSAAAMASPPQIIAREPVVNSELKKNEIKPPVSSVVKDETAAASPAVKTVVKYVEVPVVKEKIVERIVYLNKPAQKNGIENINVPNPPVIAKSENPASQFNLKDLQPMTRVNYKIIRKGENNEDE